MPFSDARTPSPNIFGDENRPSNTVTEAKPPVSKPAFFSPSQPLSPERRPFDFGADYGTKANSHLPGNEEPLPSSFFGSGSAFAFKPSVSFGTASAKTTSGPFAPCANALLQNGQSDFNLGASNVSFNISDANQSNAVGSNDARTNSTSNGMNGDEGTAANPGDELHLRTQSCPALSLATSNVSSATLFSPSRGRVSIPGIGQSSTLVATSDIAFGAVSQPKVSPSLAQVQSAKRGSQYSWVAVRKGVNRKTTSFSSPPNFLDFIIGSQDSKQTFTVHRQLAIFHSPFVKEAAEGQSWRSDALKSLKKIVLPHAESATFGLIVHYMYTEQIEDQPGTIAEAQEEDPRQSLSSDPVPLVKLYLLAQYFKMSRLQDEIIPRLILILSRASNNGIRLASELAFESSGKAATDSPLRSLLVDQVALCRRNETGGLSYEDIIIALPPQMACQITVKLRSVYERTFVILCQGKDVLKPEDYFCELAT